MEYGIITFLGYVGEVTVWHTTPRGKISIPIQLTVGLNIKSFWKIVF